MMTADRVHMSGRHRVTFLTEFEIWRALTLINKSILRLAGAKGEHISDLGFQPVSPTEDALRIFSSFTP